MSIIVHSKKLVYIHPPKTGGFSIQTFLLQHCSEVENVSHMPAATLKKMFPDTRDYYFFATVRNPWDRWVSSYFYQKPNASKEFPNLWGNGEISFEDFCFSNHEWYPAHEINFGHLRDQSHFVFDSDERLTVNELIRFERIESQFRNLCRRFDLPDVPLPHLNATSHDDYWRYYNRVCRNHIEDKFELDIRSLGYRFGD